MGLTNGAIEVAFALLIANHVPAIAPGSRDRRLERDLRDPRAHRAGRWSSRSLQVGVLDIDAALALCVGAAIGGALLYLRAASDGAHRPAPESLARTRWAVLAGSAAGA